MSDKAWGLFKDTVQVVVFAIVLTFILRSYVFETRTIPSLSMYPTLQVGDKLFVDKIVFKFNKVKHHDIVTFNPPPEALTGENVASPWIKRVIGMPGDKIQVTDGKLFVNDKAQVEPYIAEKLNYNYGPVVVPDGTIFVMGDNRNNSNDSHFWGFLPKENIQGRAFFRYWPPSRIGLIDKK